MCRPFSVTAGVHRLSRRVRRRSALGGGGSAEASGPCEGRPEGGRSQPRAAPTVASALEDARDLLRRGRTEAALRLLRALPDQGRSRSEAVALAIAAAQHDPEFQELVALADAERDARNWARAEYLYWRMLQLYPLHAGYTVQYGHCLKERGKLEDAEVVYRSALALGAPAEDVKEHIAHVHAAQGCGEAVFPAAPTEGGQPLDLPPCRADVEVLFALLLQRPPRTMSETLAMLRTAATCREVAHRLVRHDEFPAANRDLMVLLAQSA